MVQFSSATPQRSTPPHRSIITPPFTSGDCFEGALSEDPLHCYVLEQAHSEGVIEVDAVYGVGGALHIFLAQTEPVSDEILRYIREKAQDWVRRTGGDKCVLWVNGCAAGVLSTGGGYILPVSNVYETIRLKKRGAEARRSHAGWPAYRQLWPVAAGGARGDASGTTGTSDFDVSEVDMTNFPELDCATQILFTTLGACQRWARHPGLGIASWRSTDKLYVQVKAPAGQEGNVAAAREALIRWNPEGLNEDNLVIIPVKHDYEDLWRWAEVIDRFALSSGNTLGIVRAGMGENYGTNGVFPLADLPNARRRDSDGRVIDRRAEYRTTIRVYTLELQRTLDALLRLLGQLNVPVDAVGVVFQYVDSIPVRPSQPGLLKAKPMQSALPPP